MYNDAVFMDAQTVNMCVTKWIFSMVAYSKQPYGALLQEWNARLELPTCSEGEREVMSVV